jgi:uncharacterized RDD family membrane protein YckC
MKDSKAQEYWFRRLIALIIDGIIIGIVVVIIFALIAAMVALPAYFAYGYAPLSILFGRHPADPLLPPRRNDQRGYHREVGHALEGRGEERRQP